MMRKFNNFVFNNLQDLLLGKNIWSAFSSILAQKNNFAFNLGRMEYRYSFGSDGKKIITVYIVNVMIQSETLL